eukprot:TRINITY_DN982_c0_g1_i1.p2 TRINITY_DN982_c0_g1~~TRINITY_DN982_c0_g1_i1.p2  ORF type:complete len:228 (+),score=74.34 TRINITY_DN982_c0_g1_i1:1250-1933(+)
MEKGSTAPLLLTKKLSKESLTNDHKKPEINSKEHANEKIRHSLLSRVFFKSQTELKTLDSISKEVPVNLSLIPPERRHSHSTIISQREFQRATSEDANSIIKLKMMIEGKDHEVLQLLFDYNLLKDTPLEVAKEMVKEFSLDESEVVLVEAAIRQELALTHQEAPGENKGNAEVERLIGELTSMGKKASRGGEMEEAATLKELDNAFFIEALKLCERYTRRKKEICE